MRVLRENRDSVMAMLEAFVYDPLISWRLLADGNDAEMGSVSGVNSEDDGTQQKSPVEKLNQTASSLKIGVPVEYLTTEQPSPTKPSSSIRDVTALRRTISKDVNGGVMSPTDEPLQNNLNTR
jgi:hypothetical protein